jgi:hypothetical protein
MTIDQKNKPLQNSLSTLEWRCQLFFKNSWVILSFAMYYLTWKRLWFLHVLMWQFTVSLSSLFISLCILLTRFLFLFFLKHLASLHIFGLFALEIIVFFLFLQLDSLLLVCTTSRHNNTNIAKGTTIYKTLIFVFDFLHYNHIYKKRLCKYFELLTSVIMTLNQWCFLLERPKKCVRQTKVWLKWVWL